MADISKIRIGSTDYDIKDAVARLAVTNTLHFKGVTTTAVTNGGTLVPADIYKHSDGTTPTVADIAVGDMIIYGKGEYIWAMSDGAGNTSTTGHWILIDALNAYGDLASKNNVVVTNVNNGAHYHVVKNFVTGINKKATTSTGSYTPAGTVSTSIAASKAAAQVITLNGGATSNLVTTSLNKVGSATATKITSYGTLPSFTADSTKTFVTGFANNGAANKFTASVSGEILTLAASNDVTFTTNTVTGYKSFSAGSLPTGSEVTVATKGTAVTVATGSVGASGAGATVATALYTSATAKESTVTFGTITSTFDGTQSTISVSGTPDVSLAIGTAHTDSAGNHTHTTTVKYE